ncbi:2-oxo acid dehydrogenase subunit E2 [Nocardioides sp. TRM66260-LWL]|uniref:dihydrolipoamide acetyltransferase family protein n=1 Tax=Nocardioides sp. TRM66260-LWL TaxID=2874478 RepID=UPI001CC65469|nr:dihydrolipoamide acetyltransferase family protein [Nocardioides sp. TRM66260-LWL]MBZ5735721.1 2-oxo acid dehydrogenase subunit E2 [Nocardioides sp. TRM66260-LWL]
MPEYKLPDVGEGLTEAEIVFWKVAVGDTVAINDVVVEIETAKSLVELPSPYAGIVAALLVAEGETVPVGTPIIAIGEPAEAPTAVSAPAAPAPPVEIDLSNPAATGGGEGESLVGRTKAEGGVTRRPRRVATGAVAAQVQTQAAFMPGAAAPLVEAEDAPAPPPVRAAPSRSVIRALAKPPVRRLARELGVDLTALTPSGPGGIVTRADVEAAVGASGDAAMAAPGGLLPRPADAARGVGSLVGPRDTREPVKGVRKAMAEAMVASAFTAPHVTEWITVDATATVELVERLRSRRELRDLRVTPLLLLARAALVALRRTPILNSTFDAAAGEVVVHGGVNLGIAAATPRGLVVPNVKDADALSLVELAAALGELTETARAGRTPPAAMAGGTFTITNVGVFGVDAGTPIINPGESGILCVGAIRKQPWVVDDEIVVRHVTTLALSFDHRHVDGEAGSRFLADVAALVEDPALAVLF